MEDLETVTAAEQCGEDSRCRAIDDLFDEHLVVEHVVGVRSHLPAAHEARHIVGHRLESPTIALDGETVGSHCEGQRLGGRVRHQRPWHAGVVLEMPVVEPHVLGHRGGRAQIAAAPGATIGIELGDLVDQPQLPGRKGRCPRVGGRPLEPSAEAPIRVPLGEGVEIVAAE